MMAVQLIMDLLLDRQWANEQSFFKITAAAGAGSDPVYVEDVFSTHLYDGESSTSTTITINNGLDLSDKGGMLWTKSRGGAYGHYLIDSEEVMELEQLCRAI